MKNILSAVLVFMILWFALLLGFWLGRDATERKILENGKVKIEHEVYFCERGGGVI